MRLGIMELENNSEVKEAYDFFRALRKGLKASGLSNKRPIHGYK